MIDRNALMHMGSRRSFGIVVYVWFAAFASFALWGVDPCDPSDRRYRFPSQESGGISSSSSRPWKRSLSMRCPVFASPVWLCPVRRVALGPDPDPECACVFALFGLCTVCVPSFISILAVGVFFHPAPASVLQHCVCGKPHPPSLVFFCVLLSLARSHSLCSTQQLRTVRNVSFCVVRAARSLVRSFVRLCSFSFSPARTLSHSERTRAAARAPFSLSLAVRVRSFVYASLWQRFLEVLNAHRQVLPRRRSNDTHVLYARCKRETTGCVRFSHSSARFAYQARARFPMGDSFAIFAVLL